MINEEDMVGIEAAVMSRNNQVSVRGQVYHITYGVDEDGGEYALIGIEFPIEVYAEIEDGTYGILQGVRVYTEDMKRR